MVGWQIPTAVKGVITKWSHKQPAGTSCSQAVAPRAAAPEVPKGLGPASSCWERGSTGLAWSQAFFSTWDYALDV